MTTETPPATGSLPVIVRRVLDRNDLLMLARDAERAVGIVLGENDARTHDLGGDDALFSAALRLQRENARDTNSAAIRLQALDDAGVIVRFCELAGISITDTGDAGPSERFHIQALREIDTSQEFRAGEELDSDLFLGLTVRRRAIRDIRLGGDYVTAIERADLPDIKFAGSGADQLLAEYQVELGAALLLDGQAPQVRPRLAESEQGYWATEAGKFPSRHRLDYILALAAWADEDIAEASQRLTRARQHLHETGRHEERWDIEDLLLSLTQADLLGAGGDRSVATMDAVAGHLRYALDITERVRERWKVIARSRSPLSVAFRRVYGDIALAASAFHHQRIAELGLRAVLSAKQSGLRCACGPGGGHRRWVSGAKPH